MVAADYLIPIATTKKFGGSRYGVIGTTLGILFGIFIPIPMGIFVGAFIGAFIGERIHQNDHKVAIKAALGSLIGFMTSSLLKFVVSLGFMGLFLYDVWTHRDAFL